MGTERQKVLEMLSAGQINTEEAARLLECLGEPEDGDARPVENRSWDKRAQGKKLRVKVNGFMEDGKKMDVNVGVPLVLARYVDNIIANCLPEEANRELMAQGINLRQINISEIVNTFESLDEDIVSADINHDDIELTVRVYVE